MERTFRQLVGFIAAVPVVLGLAGCNAVRPISSASKPPASALVISAPFSIDQLSKATFPAGEYRPVYEDNGGYYYQAPSKIVANALFSYMYDGGLYVKRGETEPAAWFIVGGGGLMDTGPLSSMPPCQMKP